MTRRRLVLTLTPLLDLVLVVIFAQYVALDRASAAKVEQERAARESAQRAERATEQARQSAFDTLARQNERIRQLGAEAEALKAKNAELSKELERASEEYRRKLEEERREAAKQIQALAESAQQVLHVPPEAIQATFAGAAPDDARKLAQEFAALSEQTLPDLIRRLRQAAEFQKRWDVWEVHVRQNGSARFIVRGKEVKADIFAENPDDFLLRLDPVLRGLDEPKSFVLVLVSYADATRKARETVLQGLALVREKFRNFWGQEKQIHVSNIGFIPEAP